VTAPPLPPPPGPPGIVTASMTYKFGWTRKYTIVKVLVVTEVPKGGRVEVTCQGHGCPFTHHTSATVARAASRNSHSHGHSHACHGRTCKHAKRPPPPQGPEVNLLGLFKGRHLGTGVRIQVSVVKPTWIGKSFVFTTRKDKIPLEKTSCLAPGSNVPGRGC
jgi:hypothetical protein